MFIIQIVKVHNHKEHIKVSFLLAAQTSGFSKLLPTNIGECNYKHLNLSGLLNKQFATVVKTVCQSQIIQINIELLVLITGRITVTLRELGNLQ